MVKGAINQSMMKQLEKKAIKLKGAREYLQSLEADRYEDGVSLEDEIKAVRIQVGMLEESVSYYTKRLSAMGYAISPIYTAVVSKH